MHAAWPHVALAGAWGGLVRLERRAFLQAMFSRPLVAATGMGLLLGDAALGLYVGMVLELFYLGTASLGAALPENDTLAATRHHRRGGAAWPRQTGGGRHPGHLEPVPSCSSSGWGASGGWWTGGWSATRRRLARTALAAGGARRARAARCGRTSGACGRTSSSSARLTAACAAAGLAGSAAPSPRLPLAVLRGLAWAYPGDGLGGGGHRGAGLARPARGPVRRAGAAARS